MNYLDKLLTLADNIRNKKHQEVQILEEDMTNLINNLSLLQKSDNGIPDLIASKEKLLNKDHLYFSSSKERQILYLSSARLRWNWGGDYITRLNGGFAFNGIIDMIAFKNDFWSLSLPRYKKYESCATSKEEMLIKQLKWFEVYEYPSTTRLSDVFGCILHKPPNFPNQFYYYSNGLSYLLPFSTFEGYINAMIISCGVKYWQYFYIEPEILIHKNKNKSYVTHNLRITSVLEDDLYPFDKEDAKIDRLDLINEYFAHSLKHLPELFPFADFTYHQNYYKRFKELYEASKEE